MLLITYFVRWQNNPNLITITQFKKGSAKGCVLNFSGKEFQCQYFLIH